MATVQLRLDELMCERNPGYSYRKWAKELGLSVNFLFCARHRSLKRLDLAKLQRLCEYFEVTPNDLLWSENGQEAGGS